MTQEQIVAALVNPLAWIPYETDDGTRGVRADATFGKYLCVPSGWFHVCQTGWMDETDLAAAQAAAEADYRSRIAAAMDVGKIAALVEALEEIADGLKGIARDIQIGPDDEGREIYDMVQAMQWDARQALKGHNQ